MFPPCAEVMPGGARDASGREATAEEEAGMREGDVPSSRQRTRWGLELFSACTVRLPQDGERESYRSALDRNF